MTLGHPSTPATTQPRLRRACLVGVAAGAVPYLASLWNVGLAPLRGATATHLNGNFYDLQARALFRGRLDVPPGSLGVEAFVVDDRHYMYFGPFPALLRMPILAITDRFDGRLTALSMLAGWVVLAFALTALVVRVRTLVAGSAPVSRFEAGAVGVLVTAVLGGSSLVYLASQPWVYHEVYVWSAALVVALVAVLIATWTEPTPGRVVAATLLATATILTRIPAGLAMAAVLIAAGAWLALRERRVVGAGSALVLGGAAAVAAGSAVNWAKFRHPYRFPIELHEWTRLNPHRRLVLLSNDGRIDGPQFFWTDLVAYFRPDGIRFVGHPPYITFPAEPQAPIWGVHLDESFRTGSIPAFMTLLFALCAWGVVALVRRGGPPGIGALRLGLAGTIALTGGVMMFGYIAPRYTGEFVPALAVGATVGLADLTSRLRGRSPNLRRSALAAIAALGGFGVVANTATGVINARYHSRGDGLAALVTWQDRVGGFTGSPSSDRVLAVDELPSEPQLDQLAVVGDCDGVYLGDGEATSPWIAVVVRDRSFRLELGSDDVVGAGSFRLMELHGYTQRWVDVIVDPEHGLALTVTNALPEVVSGRLGVGPGDTVEILLRADTATSRYHVVATAPDGESVAVDVPMTEWNRRLHGQNIVAVADETVAAANAAALGIGLRAERGPLPDLCARLA